MICCTDLVVSLYVKAGGLGHCYETESNPTQSRLAALSAVQPGPPVIHPFDPDLDSKFELLLPPLVDGRRLAAGEQNLADPPPDTLQVSSEGILLVVVVDQTMVCRFAEVRTPLRQVSLPQPTESSSMEELKVSKFVC